VVLALLPSFKIFENLFTGFYLRSCNRTEGLNEKSYETAAVVFYIFFMVTLSALSIAISQGWRLGEAKFFSVK